MDTRTVMGSVVDSTLGHTLLRDLTNIEGGLGVACAAGLEEDLLCAVLGIMPVPQAPQLHPFIRP